jgi:hypothetical protein
MCVEISLMTEIKIQKAGVGSWSKRSDGSVSAKYVTIFDRFSTRNRTTHDIEAHQVAKRFGQMVCISSTRFFWCLKNEIMEVSVL